MFAKCLKKWKDIILIGLCLLIVSCQAQPDPNNQTSATSIEASVIAASTSAPEPTRPEPQLGTDADGDWVSDADEEKFGTDLTVWDTDDDGATDFEEIFIIGSDPTAFEGHSDEDWIRDVTEINLYNSDPNQTDEDRDGDGIPDLVELKNGADPGKMDTDGDLLSDFLELYLTETDPTTADPINKYGFPQPLETWLPEHLHSVNCEVAVVFTMDEVVVVDPEEAGSPNDINIGDEVYIKYGLWLDVPTDFDLLIDENTAYTAVWFNKTFQNTTLNRTNFRVLNPLIANCGQTVTLSVQALEDDSPWGGIWDMGTWRDDLHLVFDRIPFGYGHTHQDGFYFYGTTHDSDYEYNFTYSFAVQLLSTITSREDVTAEYEKYFNTTNSQPTTMSNEEALQAMILTWMALGMFDTSTGGNYDTQDSFDNYIPYRYYYNPATGATSETPCSGCEQRTDLVPGN